MKKWIALVTALVVSTTSFSQFKFSGVETSLMPMLRIGKYTQDSLIFPSRRGGFKEPFSLQVPLLLRFEARNKKAAFLAGLHWQYDQINIRRRHHLFSDIDDNHFALRRITIQSNSIGITAGFEYAGKQDTIGCR